MYPNWLKDKLKCPETLGQLKMNGNNYESGGKVYKVSNEILSIVYPDNLGGDDARYNKLYNLFTPLYDLNDRLMGRLLAGVDMIKGRKQIVSFPGLQPGMFMTSRKMKYMMVWLTWLFHEKDKQELNG